MSAAAFEIERLSVAYESPTGPKPVVGDVSLTVRAGEILGLAGESGCGKSTAVLAATGYPVPGMASRSGRVLLGGVDLLQLTRAELRERWGREIAYVPQDAATSLTPNRTIDVQFGQVLSTHLGLRGEAAKERTREMLEHVGLPNDVLDRYPFEFSGGQQQRIALAIALVCRPAVLILDEPTTGLDVTTQAVVSRLIEQLVRELGTATIYVSHDLALLHSLCDSMAIMYAGQLVEQGSAEAIIRRARHPYTAALLDAVPTVDRDETLVAIPGRPPGHVVADACAFASRCRYAVDLCRADGVELVELDQQLVRCVRAAEITPGSERAGAALDPRSSEAAESVLSVAGLTATYAAEAADSPVVDDVSFELAPAEILGIVGESGSGKTTLLRSLVGLHPRTGGEVRLRGAPVPARIEDRDRTHRREIQIVFQNPASSLNPRHTVRHILARPLQAYFPDQAPAERDRRIKELIDDVQLDEAVVDSLPGELSGGQQQRVALARALAAEPSVILCDEVVSALDVSVQAAIIDLIRKLRSEADLAVVFVTHDLAVVRTLADRVLVMKDGRAIEEAGTRAIFDAPETHYTRELLAAAPRMDAAAVSDEPLGAR